MQYIRSAEPQECPFCLPATRDEDRARLVLLRGEHAYVCMNLYPYNNGHLLIPPYEHTGDFVGLRPEVLAEIGELARQSARILGEHCRPDGFNIGYNLGRAAGAGVAEHLHLHVIPRWNGDTSFLSTVGGTKVIVQSLCDTYEELKPLFDAARS